MMSKRVFWKEMVIGVPLVFIINVLLRLAIGHDFRLFSWWSLVSFIIYLVIIDCVLSIPSIKTWVEYTYNGEEGEI